MGKRGPAPKGEYADKTAVLSTRITRELRLNLEKSSRKSRRSLSSEIEYRLRRSYEEDESITDRFGSREAYALLRLIGLSAELSGGSGSDWLHDGNRFDQALNAITGVLEQFRPKTPAAQAPLSAQPGNNPDGWGIAHTVAAQTEGLATAADLIEAISGKATPTTESRRNRKPLKVLPRIKQDLGSLKTRVDPDAARERLGRARANVASKLGNGEEQ